MARQAPWAWVAEGIRRLPAGRRQVPTAICSDSRRSLLRRYTC